MKLNIYSIRDVKSETYGIPFTMVNDQVAIRAVTQMVNAGDNQLAFNPEDFALYSIGMFDDVSGEIVAYTPVFIVQAYSCRTKLGVVAKESEVEDVI